MLELIIIYTFAPKLVHAARNILGLNRPKIEPRLRNFRSQPFEEILEVDTRDARS